MLLRATAILLLTLPLAACSETLEGFEWEVNITSGGESAQDNCNPEPQGFEQEFVYRLEFDGSDVSVAIGPDVFATGQISGCNIAYQSVVWGEEKDGYTYRWRIDGDAIYRQGSGCDNQLEPTLDWFGTETFTILESDDPDIAPNCTYILDAEGEYLGPADR